MKLFNRLATTFLFVLALLPAARGYAGEPTAQLSATVILDRVQVETNDPRPCGNAAQALRVGGQFG